MTLIAFTTRNGEQLTGELVHQYPAFEGGMRYILVNHGKEYRCVKDEQNRFVELVV